MAWYRVGTIALTSGSDLVTGTGTAWVQNAVPGGILFSTNGLALEVKKALSDTSLQLAQPYTGATVAGLAYGIAPTQAYVPELTAKLQEFLDGLGDLRQEWLDGNLQGQGLALKGAVDSQSELPLTGNAAGDGYMVGSDLFIWTGTAWSNRGKMVTTAELEALRQDAVDASDSAEATRIAFEDRNYPGVYASPPTSKPHSGAPSEDGDTCVALVSGLPYVHRRLGGGWLIPDIDAVDLANRTDPAKGAKRIGYDGQDLSDVLNVARPLATFADLLTYMREALVVQVTTGRKAGFFKRSLTDFTTPADGVFVVVDVLGRRWFRMWSGPVLLEWATEGDGTTFDTAGLLLMIKSGRFVLGRAGDVYLLDARLTFTDLVKTQVDFAGATLMRYLATAPTAGSGAGGILTLTASSFGASRDVIIRNVRLTYSWAPTSRRDNNFVIYADGIDGLELANFTVEMAWAAGVWFRRCNNINAHEGLITNTKADGIHAQACGRGVTFRNILAQTTGDDGIALTWFAGDDPAYVGLTDGQRRTRGVVFDNCRTYDSAKRGIFVGGIAGGSILNCRVERSNSAGILLARDTVNALLPNGAPNPFYNAAGVNNASEEVEITGNVVLDCAIGSNSPDAEVGGIWVVETNVGCRVHHNTVKRCNGVHIYIGGGVEYTFNTSVDPQFVATGTVTAAQMPYKGDHVAIADYSNTGTCHGRVDQNTFVGGPGRAVTIGNGDSVKSWSVSGNRIQNVGDLSGASGGRNAVSAIRIANLPNGVVRDNVVTETRAGMAVTAIVSLAANGGTLVADNRVLSAVSGYASELVLESAGVSTRSRLRVKSTQGAIALSAGQKTDFEVVIAGLSYGMPVGFSPPGDIQGATIRCVQTAAGKAKVYVVNETTGPISVAAGDWQLIAGG